MKMSSMGTGSGSAGMSGSPGSLPQTGGATLPIAGLVGAGLFSLGFGLYSRRRAS